MQVSCKQLSVFAYVALYLLAHLSMCMVYATQWTQDSYTKKIDLGGSVNLMDTRITATPAEVSSDGIATYVLYLSRKEHEGLSMLSATLDRRGNEIMSTNLEVKPLGELEDDQANTFQYGIDVPMEKPVEIDFTIKGVFLYQSRPLPKELAQGELQMLLWEGDAQPRTPYATRSSEVQINSPDPVLTFDAPVKTSKAGDSIHFGPVSDLEPYEAGSGTVATGSVHFSYSRPMIAYIDYQRHVQVSHWADRMTTQDNIWLQNVGPKLKGHFSRSKHMINMHMNPLMEKVAQIQSIPLNLPGGADEVYFVDATGNVSTSQLRPSPLAPTAPRRMDIKPRFPVLGGWNYTFTVGWSERMSKSRIARFNPAQPSRKRVAVPFLISPRTAAINNATLMITLPEGARDIRVTLPFKVDKLITGRNYSYLDLFGRPTITISRERCSFMNSMPVYVEYTLPMVSYAFKLFTVFAAVMVVFLVSRLVNQQIYVDRS